VSIDDRNQEHALHTKRDRQAIAALSPGKQEILCMFMGIDRPLVVYREFARLKHMTFEQICAYATKLVEKFMAKLEEIPKEGC
jgi:hypothetical protein